MFNFTEEQKIAALTLNKPLVVTAAAGSGKTTVLVARYIELLKSGLRPNQILTVTFTTDAAEQLRERILKALEFHPELNELALDILRSRFIGTIHSFCYYLISEYGSLLKLAPIEEIISDYQFQIKLESSFHSWLNSLSSQELNRLISLFPRHELRPLFNSLYENRYHLSLFHENQDLSKPLNFCFDSALPFLRTLERDLHESGRFRFDDLEHLSIRLLKEHPKLREKLMGQFQAMLIDEFQDTSKNQWSLFHQLLGKELQKLFVVGDPKQSIYSFRHADVSLFFEVSQLAETQGGLVTELNTNFRSQRSLIEDINRLSESFFKDSPIPFQKMVSGTNCDGSPIKQVYYDVSEDLDKKESELHAVIKSVQEHLKAGHSPGELALLFRMGDRIEVYHSALKSCGIPVDSTQTLSLFSHYDVLDLVHYLKALSNPLDQFSLLAFLNSPWVSTSLEELAALRDNPKDTPVEPLVQKQLGSKLDWFFSLQTRSYLPIRDALLGLFSNTAYFPRHYEAFYEWLKPLTEKNYSVQEAITDLELWKREGILFKMKSKDSEGEAIKLMTVHASKGLEFEHVLLVDNLRKPPAHLPTLLSSPDEPSGLKYRKDGETTFCQQYEVLKKRKELLDFEESRRILYVALTRAKTTLTLFLPAESKGVPQGSWASILKESLG